MSDFDKEAEREKLREKYEQEEKRRETTEQMSELLLKGATMTNAHCSDCGDPIFRYDGQEFCPTCQKPVDRGTGEDATNADDSAENGATEDAGQSDGIEVTEPSDDASVQFGGDATAPESPGAVDQARDELENQRTDSSAANDGRDSNGTESARQVSSADPARGPASTQRPQNGTEPASTGTAAHESVGGHLDAARAVLAQTVERHAKLAADADSPRAAREHLETAREAAETLDATGY